MRLVFEGQIAGQVTFPQRRKFNSGGGTRTPDTRIMILGRRLGPRAAYLGNVLPSNGLTQGFWVRR